MSIFDDIRRDREAGTPGPWESIDGQIWSTLGDEPKDAYYYIDCLCDVRSNSGWPKYKKFPVFANAARIARTPILEDIALAAEDAIAAMELAEAQLIAHGFDGHGSGLTAALAKLREATA